VDKLWLVVGWFVACRLIVDVERVWAHLGMSTSDNRATSEPAICNTFVEKHPFRPQLQAFAPSGRWGASPGCIVVSTVPTAWVVVLGGDGHYRSLGKQVMVAPRGGRGASSPIEWAEVSKPANRLAGWHL